MQTLELLPQLRKSEVNLLRFGLCCLFKDEPVSFRTTTAKVLTGMPQEEQLIKLSGICLDNARNLQLGVEAAHRLKIGAFRIMSPLFPRMTHPVVGYTIDKLPDGDAIYNSLIATRAFAARHNIRLSFHPDQFVVLSSPHQAVIANSIRELEYQVQLAEVVGADSINIHAGGVYGDKQSALQRFKETYGSLSEPIRRRLTLENDDISYTPGDLLPICLQLSIPLVYDVHHHRCNPDNMTIEEATERAETTWKAVDREQCCHISSPKTGWSDGNPRPHADYIDLNDVPNCWLGRNMTVDVEAKAKELAVVRLMKELSAAKASS